MRGRQRVIVSLLAVIAVLFISMYVGTNIGNRIRTMATNQSTGVTLPTPIPDSEASLSPAQTGWKHIQVIAVATDPAFPDPRLTPTPEPPTPSPSPFRPPTPAPAAPRPPDNAQNNSNRPVWEVGTPRPTTPSYAQPQDDLGQ